MHPRLKVFTYSIVCLLITFAGSNLAALDSAAAAKYFGNIDFNKLQEINITNIAGGNQNVSFTISTRNGPRIVKVGKNALWISKPKIKWTFILSYKQIVYVNAKGGKQMYIVVN